MPVTTPDVFIDAVALELLLHVPPVVASASVVVEPTHTDAVPVIAAGSGFTVTIAFDWQPVVVSTYDMATVPALTPVTMPVAAPTVAVPVPPLTHVPLGDVLASVVVAPTHTCIVPVTGFGAGFTVISFVALHPVGLNVYDMVTVPVVTPVTIPEEMPIVAVVASLLYHNPPGDVLL